MTGIHYKQDTRCPLAIANRDQNLAEVCHFSVRKTSTPSFANQINENSFILFTGKDMTGSQLNASLTVGKIQKMK